MLKKILVGVLAVVVVLVIVIAVQPAEFRIVRTATISAHASVVFPHVNDFRKWEAWSPWEKLDPDMKRVYEGALSGQGAGYFWSGNDRVGEGRMTITEVRPDEFISIKLDFLKPFEMTNTAEFTFRPDGNHTEVSWAMYGENNFLGKAFSLFVDMDQAVGADFERGLTQMKGVVEATNQTE